MRLTEKVNNEYITDDTKCMKNKYITKLGQIEDLMDKYEISDIKALETILEDYEESTMFTIAVYAYLAHKGLVQDFKDFVNNFNFEELE